MKSPCRLCEPETPIICRATCKELRKFQQEMINYQIHRAGIDTETGEYSIVISSD